MARATKFSVATARFLPKKNLPEVIEVIIEVIIDIKANFC